jgi:hypothetical protein
MMIKPENCIVCGKPLVGLAATAYCPDHEYLSMETFRLYKDVAMTKYFTNPPLPKDFPWDSWEAFNKGLEETWEEMKSEGVRLGKLEVTPEGWLKGHGNPNDWFDAVEKNDKRPNSTL